MKCVTGNSRTIVSVWSVCDFYFHILSVDLSGTHVCPKHICGRNAFLVRRQEMSSAHRAESQHGAEGSRC